MRELVYDRHTRTWKPTKEAEQQRAFVKAMTKAVVKQSVRVVLPLAIQSLAIGVAPWFPAAAAVVAVVAPVTDATASWTNLFAAALSIADWLCVGVFMFAGASWMFGNRTKALELLIGGATGYLIIRKSVLIRDFLRTL